MEIALEDSAGVGEFMEDSGHDFDGSLSVFARFHVDSHKILFFGGVLNDLAVVCFGEIGALVEAALGELD